MSKRARPKKGAAPKPAAEASSLPSRYLPLILIAILLVAASLRLAGLGRVAPPGLNQDEAANAWNAYCLLKTGQDQAGVRWPVFYSRCLGANRSTLYLYVLMPFQAIGGLNVLTTRLPSALGGVLTVLLTYYVGSRLFGRWVGLVAAALLAVNPWHLQQSRWGHEAALCTLLVMGPVAAMLWAGIPFSDATNSQRRHQIGLAVLAGALTGACCYGYPAVRLFLPLFLMAADLVTWRGWWERLRTRIGGLTICALIIGLAATFGPLLWAHLTDAEGTGISRRSRTTWAWKPNSTFGDKVAAVLGRYPGHFGLDFLFINGDGYEIQSVPGYGQFHWYMLPLMGCGVLVLIRRAWSSRATRVLLVWVLIYPLSDCLSAHGLGGLHALRSSPGMCSLILLGALGAVSAVEWLWPRERRVTIALGGLFAVAAVGLNVRFLHTFFGAYNDRQRVYHIGYHVDLLQACDWLRPRLDHVDAVYCTTIGMNTPYIVTLVGLGYDPQQWFKDHRDPIWLGPWLNYRRYGKMNFVYPHRGRSPWRPILEGLSKNGRSDRVILIFRPGEVPLKRPDYEIVGPKLRLWVCERTL
jgi:4-amino-4-deoxy-L-arabinose transferase-like glycosyltransferase